MTPTTLKKLQAMAAMIVTDPSELAEVRRRLEMPLGEKSAVADRWLTSKEAAEMLGVCVRTLFNYERREKKKGTRRLTARRQSASKIRWSRNEVAAFAGIG